MDIVGLVEAYNLQIFNRSSKGRQGNSWNPPSLSELASEMLSIDLSCSSVCLILLDELFISFALFEMVILWKLWTWKENDGVETKCVCFVCLATDAYQKRIFYAVACMILIYNIAIHLLHIIIRPLFKGKQRFIRATWFSSISYKTTISIKRFPGTKYWSMECFPTFKNDRYLN